MGTINYEIPIGHLIFYPVAYPMWFKVRRDHKTGEVSGNKLTGGIWGQRTGWFQQSEKNEENSVHI